MSMCFVCLMFVAAVCAWVRALCVTVCACDARVCGCAGELSSSVILIVARHNGTLTLTNNHNKKTTQVEVRVWTHAQRQAGVYRARCWRVQLLTRVVLVVLVRATVAVMAVTPCQPTVSTRGAAVSRVRATRGSRLWPTTHVQVRVLSVCLWMWVGSVCGCAWAVFVVWRYGVCECCVW